MQVFNCSHCGKLVFFDSVRCVHCGSTLAFVPDRMAMHAITPAEGAAPGLWTLLPADGCHTRYRQCYNQTQWHACNFAVPESSSSLLCVACRQTVALPDLSLPGHLAGWTRLEAAKRQLFYTLARLGLQSVDDGSAPDPGPRYAFLADWPDGEPVMTGHAGGTITINVAEADDAERLRHRVSLREPYRTLLGHFRHESGHYYWDRLVLGSRHEDAFRTLFGDERQDYGQALERYYAAPECADWHARFVSAYASSHPWEDWAETWAHYLHLIDLLETAAAYDTSLELPGAAPAERVRVLSPFGLPAPSFDTMVLQWSPLTLLLNSLNRSLGQDDAYPFALSTGALRKLQFVHELVQSKR